MKLFICSVFDGIPRNKQQIEATSGSLLGEAEREGIIKDLLLLILTSLNL